MSNIKQIQLAELGGVLSTSRRVDEIIFHHTWRPTAADYRGAKTWEAIRRYHTETRGWSDIGYHFGVGPDGSLWVLRPIGRGGAHCLGHNAHSVGVVLLGNYDAEDPWANSLSFACEVMAKCCSHYDLKPRQVYFHRDFANKSCPGLRIERREVRQLVEKILAGQTISPTEPDVDEWAQPWVERAIDEGLLTGYPDGTFRGRRPVTRQELAAALVRLKDRLSLNSRLPDG